jgi:malate dehydrogenase (oxaloacetate-decarboxylating)(NADP+)
MKNDLRKQQALEYHAKGRPGKIEVIPTKEAKKPILPALLNPAKK